MSDQPPSKPAASPRKLVAPGPPPIRSLPRAVPVIDIPAPETYLEHLHNLLAGATGPRDKVELLQQEVVDLLPEMLTALRVEISKGNVNACIALQRIQCELAEQLRRQKDIMPPKPEELGFTVEEGYDARQDEAASEANDLLEGNQES